MGAPSITLPTPLDPSTNDAWGTTLNTAITTVNDEHGTRTGSQNFADQQLSRPIFLDYGELVVAKGNVTGAVTIDITGGNHQTLTLTGNVTLTVNNPAPTGNFAPLFLYITQDGTGGRTVTFPAAFVDTAGNNFSISGTTASTTVEVFAYTLDAGSTWRTRQGLTWS